MKINRIIIVSIFILLIVIFLIIKFNLRESPLENSNNSTIETTTIIHKDFRAIIDYNWEEAEGSNLGYFFYTYFPPEENKQSENVEFIFVSIGHVGEEINYTLDELLEVGIEQSKTTMPDINLTNKVNKEGKYFSGKEIQFTGTSEGVMREFIQFFGFKYGNIYTITYSCPLNKCNYYSVYNTLVDTFEPVEAEKKN